MDKLKVFGTVTVSWCQKHCPIVYYAIVRVREGEREEDGGRKGRGRKEGIKEGKDGGGRK